MLHYMQYDVWYVLEEGGGGVEGDIWSDKSIP